MPVQPTHASSPKRTVSTPFPRVFAFGRLIGLMLSVSICTASKAEQPYSPQELEAAKAKLREHGADSQEYQNQLRLVRDAAYRFLEKPLYDDSMRKYGLKRPKATS